MTQVYDYRAFLDHAPALRESASPDLFTLDEQIRLGKRQDNPLRKSIQIAVHSQKFNQNESQAISRKDQILARNQLPSMARTELPRWVQKMTRKEDTENQSRVLPLEPLIVGHSRKLVDTYTGRYYAKQQLQSLLPPDPHLNTEERSRHKRLGTLAVHIEPTRHTEPIHIEEPSSQDDVNVYYEEITIKAPELTRSIIHDLPHTSLLEQHPYETQVTVSHIPTQQQQKIDHGWKPYTLRDYKAQMQALRHSKQGSLGPSFGEEHNKQLEKLKRVKMFSNSLRSEHAVHGVPVAHIPANHKQFLERNRM